MRNYFKLIIRFILSPDLYISRMRAILYHYRYGCPLNTIIIKPLSITPQYIKFGRGVFIYNKARIEGVRNYAGESYSPSIEIGEGVTIQQNLHLTCALSVTIGSYTAITHNVTITDIDHSYEYAPKDYPPPIDNLLIIKEVKIGNRCLIFANSVILAGSVIGNNCVVAANTVVRGRYPDNCVIAGSPAKVVKRYNPLSGNWERTNPDGTFIIT